MTVDIGIGVNLDELALPQELLLEAESEHGNDLAFDQPQDDMRLKWSWAEAVHDARCLVSAMRQLGLERGDRVAILSKNTAHWIIADYAIMLAGYVSVPIYPTANAKTIAYVLEHSGCKAIFIGKLDNFTSQEAGVPSDIIRMDMTWPSMPCEHRWGVMIEQSEPAKDIVMPDLDDMMTILYTSGSTGKPKGAVHTYRSFSYAGKAIGSQMDTDENDRILSYLPLAHCTERAYVESSQLYQRQQLFFADSLESFASDLVYCRPTFFGSVPRLWKKFQLGVLGKMPQHKLDKLLKLPVVGNMVRKKIRKGLGLDKCEWFMSGSAPIAPSLLDWWAKLGMPISEGWGMTETLAYGTLLRKGGRIKIGTIGIAGPGAEIRLGDQDEVQIKVGSLMTGYLDNPEQTAETMTADGFLKTGDKGSIDEEGYIRITGRVKEIFKTSKGKYVAPVPIESQFEKNEHIEMVCLVGSGLPQPVLIALLAETSREMDREVTGASLEALLESVNSGLESHERVSRIIVINDEWTTENDMLTPTLKIKRSKIESQYKTLSESQSTRDSVIFE